jgi:hypothetical protein
MRKPSLKDAVALLDLPSWEHVGALLLSHGITDGDQEDCRTCPVAQFLAITAERKVSVGATQAWPGWYGNRRGIPLPAAAVYFIAWFDDIGRA